MHRMRIGTVALALAVSGCSLTEQSQRFQTVLQGAQIDQDADEVRRYRENQDRVLREFAIDAGVIRLPAEAVTTEALLMTTTTAPASATTLATLDSSQWKRVVGAGYNYIDRQCEKYIQAIFEIDRARKAVTTQITVTGAATAAIMGLASASAKAIAVTAAAFGLAAATSENLYGTLLYQLEPSSVRSLVEKMQDAVRVWYVSATFNDRTQAVEGIQRYVATCLPASIEAKVNEVVKDARISPPVTSPTAVSTPAAASTTSPTTTPQAGSEAPAPATPLVPRPAPSSGPLSPSFGPRALTPN
jgi:hypothetical protein